MTPLEMLTQRERLEKAEKLYKKLSDLGWLIGDAFNKRNLTISCATANTSISEYSVETGELFCEALRSYGRELEAQLEQI